MSTYRVPKIPPFSPVRSDSDEIFCRNGSSSGSSSGNGGVDSGRRDRGRPDVPLLRTTDINGGGADSPMIELESYSSVSSSRDMRWFWRLSAKFLAEFLATMVMILFGVGAVAQAELGSVLDDKAGGGGSPSGYTPWLNFNVNLGWGLGVWLGVTLAAGISGAHLNPAVSTAMSLLGRMPLTHLPVYALAQVSGAFAGAAIVYFEYREAMVAYDAIAPAVNPGGVNASAAFFYTIPQPFLSDSGWFIDQILGTALLLLAVLAFEDQSNGGAAPAARPALIGATVLAIGTAFGFNAGYAINPARDLGPRLLAAAVYGPGVFAHSGWWAPIAGPLLGGPAGAGLYLGAFRHARGWGQE